MAKILIVDDDKNNRLLLTTLLEYAGHVALEAATGTAGAQIAASELPDVVIVDLSLPDMSGAELIRRLRKDPLTEHLTVALYTATNLSPAIEELVALYDIRGVIPKPGDPREILESIQRIVGT